MRPALIAVATLIAIPATVPILAQQAPSGPPGAKDVSRISGGTYTADPGHSLVRWTVDHLGFTPYTGLFGNVQGTLMLDPQRPGSAKVDVTIPVSEVTTASEGLTQHLLRPAPEDGKADFFGADPADARFVSTQVTTTGAQSATVTGNLTLNGITRPVTLDAQFYGAGTGPQQMGGKENVGFTATGSINRSDYGIGFGIPMISDEVKLDIVAAFTK